MKKINFIRLLVLMLVLMTSINSAWAWNWDNGQIVIWDAGETNWNSAYFTVGNGNSNSGWWSMTRLGSSSQFTYTGSSQWNNYGWGVFCSQNNWDSNNARTTSVEQELNGKMYVSMNTRQSCSCATNEQLNWQVVSSPVKGTSGYTIYFDDTDTQWGSGNMYFKYGVSWTNGGYNRKIDFSTTKVPGTQNLYKLKVSSSDATNQGATNEYGQLSHDIYYQKWYVSKNYGYTNTNDIIDSHVLERTDIQTSAINSDYTLMPTSVSSGAGTDGNPKIWTTTAFAGHTRTVTIESPSNGTITVSYTDENNTAQNFTSSYRNVAQTCIITVTATPSDGYYLGNLSVGGATISSGSTYVVRGNVTISAIFEHRYSVTVASGGNGTVSTSSVTAGSYTPSGSITATANAGYYFTGWTLPDGVTAAAGFTSTSNPIQINTTASSKTITANFAKRFVLRGTRSDDSGDEGMPGFSATTADMDISDDISSKEVTLLPNREYKFMIYDLVHGRQCGYTTTNNTLAANTWTGSMNGEYHLLMNTAGYGIYTFEVRVSSADGSGNTWPEVRIINPDSYQISMGYQTKSDGVASASPGDGGSVSAKDGDNYTIENTSWVKSGGSVTFTATPNEGYQFVGWYNSSTTNGAANIKDAENEPISTENPYTISDITEAKTVYALFGEILFDVNVDDGSGTQVVKQVGILSHPSITAVVPEDKVFYRWVTTGSAVLSDNYANPATINTVSDNQSTVMATFKDLPYIYYNKTAATGWNANSMYVYFYTSPYWNASKGSGYKNRTDYCYQMTKVDESGNLWRCQYDPKNFSGSITNVAFMEKDQRTYEYFSQNTGSYCDYHSCMNMFVVTSSSGDGKNSDNGNTTYYYNDDWSGNRGYWSNYENEEEDKVGLASGFYLNNLTSGSFSEEFVDEDGDGTFTVKANLGANTTYKFYIGGCGGGNWSNKDDHLAVDNSDATMYYYSDVAADNNKTQITTTVGGYYTFILSPSMNMRQMNLAVEYPVVSGDYRVTLTHGGKKFPSNIIKKDKSSGVVSLWLDNGNNNIDIEKCTGTNPVAWTKQVTRTATTPKAGVYTMTLTCADASSTISTPEAYSGNYYIRTDWAPGGWQDYKENPMIQNTLTYIEGNATTFDYYFCKWISKSGTDANVRFVVANEYNMAISDTLKTDDALDGQEYLPSGYPANVRFSWNSSTNTVNRAYIAGSTNPNDRFLIMHGNVVSDDHKLLTSSGEVINYHSTYNNLNSDEAYFSDKNNWVYQIDLKAKSGAETYLTARYNGDDRVLYGSSTDWKPIITSSDPSTAYNITVTYDFKTNNLMTAWKPGSTTINEMISGIPSVMLLRDHQETADQITIGTGSVEKTTVYGVMQFNKYTLNNQSRSGGHAALPTVDEAARSKFERDLFWISFPFDVNLRDVFGFGEYGKHWIIEYYDGQGRADNGFWADSPSNWKFVTPAMRNNYVLEKGVGYILALDLDELGAGSSIWNNSVTDVYLYFPSNTTVTINADKAIINVPAHKCNIGPRFTNGDDRRIKDSHWNVIGVPSFANVGGLTPPGTFEGDSYPDGLGFYYRWRMSDNTLIVQAAGDETFKTMHAYMVQFTGTINWITQTAIPSSVAARTQTTADRDYKLVLLRESEEDHTLLRLTDDASVSNRFEFNYDLSKEYNAGRGNIWTVTADTVEVAGNSMPKPVQTTLVPVGVKVVANGEYTFAMPEGTNGEDVFLIDNAYGTRTNLGLMPYTVTLTAGTYEGRFALEFAPIQDSPTSLENDANANANANANADVRKVFVGGRLYIIRDGKVYDAAGQRIE